jgi:hypothetical protein
MGSKDQLDLSRLNRTVFEALEPTSFHTTLVDFIDGCSRDDKVPQAL